MGTTLRTAAVGYNGYVQVILLVVQSEWGAQHCNLGKSKAQCDAPLSLSDTCNMVAGPIEKGPSCCFPFRAMHEVANRSHAFIRSMTYGELLNYNQNGY